MIQLMIADDHPVVREGLKRILADQDDMAVVAEATTLGARPVVSR